MINNAFYPRQYLEITRTQEMLLEKCRDAFLIGRLRASNPTNVTQNGLVQFYVDPLCDDPEPIINMDVFNYGSNEYIGFDDHQKMDMLPQFYDLQDYDMAGRSEQIEEFFRDKLIIFHPRYVKSHNNGRWFKNLYITGLKEDNADVFCGFVAVPRVVMETARFEQILKKGDYFDLVDYDGEVNAMPELVLCGQYIYKLSNGHRDEEFLQYNSIQYTRWKCTNIDHVVKLNLSTFDSYKMSVISASDGLVFIEKNLYSDIMLSDDVVQFEDEKRPGITMTGIEQDSDNEDEETEVVVDEKQERELSFLRGLKQLTMENGLQYKEKDLFNFHISVKTNPLTILSGMSGTGKSRLAMNYARMLDLSEDNNTLLFLPITPSYTEPSDVLGYLNSMNGLFVPSESGLIRILNHANENPDQMHMVIFDEMNLSQVEHWFSPFISILEKDKNERILKLYDEDAHCINSKVYPHSIRIGENVIFVGTVNIDDTTKNFSDRLLDRVFVINLGMVSFTDFYNAYNTYQQQNNADDLSKAKCKNVSEFISWCKGNDKRYMEAFKGHEEELTFFDDLSRIINKYIPSGGISHRVLKNIGNYILNVPLKGNDTIIDRREVIDMVVTQTVMTKIRGTETQLSYLIGTVSETGDLENSELINLLNAYNNVSDFKLVKECLLTKAEELRINGYTN